MRYHFFCIILFFTFSLLGHKTSQKITSRAEKQMLQLQLRQRELKQAALNAKKEGDMDLARDYLRQAKGIQPLIEASKAGLPVDMDSIPLSPLEKVELSISQKDESFTLVSAEGFLEGSSGTDEQIYENLEMQLVKQIMVTNIFSRILRIRFGMCVKQSYRMVRCVNF
jgi:coiled-coil and C2 domain-containing protein 1